MADPTGLGLGHAVALLGAAVVAVPLFRRFGLGAVLGYLAAGLVLGPSVLGVVAEPETMLHVAEFGIVLFLFIIGLEMRPARLWKLRREIFGLGVAGGIGHVPGAIEHDQVGVGQVVGQPVGGDEGGLHGIGSVGWCQWYACPALRGKGCV